MAAAEVITKALDSNPHGEQADKDLRTRKAVKRVNLDGLPDGCYVTPMVRNYAELVKSSRGRISVDEYSNPAIGYAMAELTRAVLTDDNKVANKTEVYSIHVPFRTDDPGMVKALNNGHTSKEIVAALAQSGAHGRMYRMTRIAPEDMIEIYDEDMFSPESFDADAPFVAAAPK